MKRVIPIITACSLAIFSSSGEEILRDWTNSEGKTITASLVGVEDGRATLRLENGRTYEVPLDTLSDADRTYAGEWLDAAAAAAKSGEMGLKYAVLGEPIVHSAFSEDTPPVRKGTLGEWKAGIGEWRIEDGSLVGDELAEDNHASSLTHEFEAQDIVIRAQVKLGTADQIAFACRDTVEPHLHLGRLYITPDKLWIQHMTGIAKTTTAEKIATLDVEIDPEEWYDVTIEIVGDTYRAKVGNHEIEAKHSRFADAKAIIALVNRGQGARWKDVGIWKAEAAE